MNTEKPSRETMANQEGVIDGIINYLEAHEFEALLVVLDERPDYLYQTAATGYREKYPTRSAKFFGDAGDPAPPVGCHSLT